METIKEKSNSKLDIEKEEKTFEKLHD